MATRQQKAAKDWMLKREALILGNHSIWLKEGRLIYEHALGQLNFVGKSIHELHEEQDAFFLGMPHGIYLRIPYSAFSSDAEKNSFLEQLNSFKAVKNTSSHLKLLSNSAG